MSNKTVTNAVFPQWHDPLDVIDYGFKFRLTDPEAVVSAAVIVVDPITGLAPIVAGTLTLSNVSFGLLDDGIRWGVTVWVSGGTRDTDYYLQCTITTNSTPLARVIHRTVKLHCAKR